ncbi:MAG: hypothetical protein ACXIVQ_13685 [Acidimicrobiales bacterium]
MAITEPARHKLYQRLESVLGEEEANTLMAHLPPVGWADVATKTDLAHLEIRLESRFDSVDARCAAIDARFEAMESRIASQFEAVDARFEAVGHQIQTIEARMLGAIDRSSRVNTLVTIGVLGTLATVLSALT